MLFDIDPWGRYLCTGTQSGRVLFYDTQTFQLVCELDNFFGNGSGSTTGSSNGDGGSSSSGDSSGSSGGGSSSSSSSSGSSSSGSGGKGDDGRRKKSSCVHTVLFHPYYSILSTVCGERGFASFDYNDDAEDDTKTDSHRSNSNDGRPVVDRPLDDSRNVGIWSLSKNQINYSV